MGAARSGSTVVGVALGNCAGGFYAGELDLYPALRGVPTAPGDERLAFWTSVRRTLRRSGYTPNPDWRKWFEHPRSLANTGQFRSPRVYRDFNDALYHSISAESGAAVVVDSSHHPLRRLRLGRLRSVTFCTLYLVRDPVEVVRSLQTDISPKRRLAANVYVWCVAGLAELVFAVVRGPKLRLRFEDFTADPAETTRRVCALCPDLDSAGVDYDVLSTGLPLAGNRIIRNATIRVRPSRSAATRDYSRWVQLPWRVRSGYR